MKSKVIKYGIFWIPKKELRGFVKSWKDKVSIIEPNAQYLQHPIHSTVFLFYGEKHKESEYLYLISQSNPTFGSAKWLVFENDSITGLDTLTISLEKSLAWGNLQIKIAESIKPSIIKPIEYPNTWEGTFKSSYQNYGFPFVGKHWIPHLTIASFKNKSFVNNAILTSILTNKINYGEIALYRIEGEIHTKIYAN